MIELPLTVVILAAGKGTRLGPLRLAHSKAMTPILGVPVIQKVLESFSINGCHDFLVVGSPDDEPLISWAQSFHNGGLRVRLAFQEERKGTAHALLQARSSIHQDFVVTSCDNIFPASHVSNLLTAHLAHRPPAVLTTSDYQPEDLERSAGVKLMGDMVQEIVEKPGRDSTGWDAISKFLFIFRKDLLDCLDAVRPSARGELELQDAITLFMEISDEFCRAVKINEFLHLTSQEDLIHIHRHYLKNHRQFIIHPEAKVRPGVTIHHPVMIGRRSLVESSCELGPFVYVGDDARVESGARLKNSVVYPGARVSSEEEVQDRIVL
ncbi:MAG: NDP-sugar synthase [bacterium]